jgi:methionyl-tRNA formyltransferase
MKVILLAKKDKSTLNEIISFLEKKDLELEVHTGDTGEKFPFEGEFKGADIIISYLSPWIVPENILKKVNMCAVNFHPGPPEYPGIGCYNFALAQEEDEYGVTVHHMASKVDTGRIIAVKRFAVLKDETVFSLAKKSYEAMRDLFFEVIDPVLRGETPASSESWKRKPYTRKELEELCVIDPEISGEDLVRLVRATTFLGKPGPYIEIHGKRFEYNPER